jgi:hypothetical protein
MDKTRRQNTSWCPKDWLLNFQTHCDQQSRLTGGNDRKQPCGWSIPLRCHKQPCGSLIPLRCHTGNKLRCINEMQLASKTDLESHTQEKDNVPQATTHSSLEAFNSSICPSSMVGRSPNSSFKNQQTSLHSNKHKSWLLINFQNNKWDLSWITNPSYFISYSSQNNSHRELRINFSLTIIT